MCCSPRAACPGPGIRPSTPSPRSMRRSSRRRIDPDLRQHALAGGVRRSSSCGRSTTTTCPSRCTTARLAAEQRRKVEAAMARGDLRAVVCTSTLDLGIDWGDVDLVIQLAAPKGASRLVQRIGRANHRLDEPSPRPVGAGQPVRDAGMPGRARGGRRERLRLGAAAHRARWTPWPSTSWAAPVSEPFDLLDDLYAEVTGLRPLSRPDLGGVRGGRRFRRHRRLCAAHL